MLDFAADLTYKRRSPAVYSALARPLTERRISTMAKKYFRCDYSQFQSEPYENAACIPLTGGKHAIIDAEDFEKVFEYQWYTKVGAVDRLYYARRIATVFGKRKTVAMHSLILPHKEGFMTDHIDGNGLNNRRSNLRYATFTENVRNRKVARTKDRKTQYKGVEVTPRWQEGRRKWNVKITVDGKKIYIGSFHEQIDAAKAYDAAAMKYHGQFAGLNFPLSTIDEIVGEK